MTIVTMILVIVMIVTRDRRTTDLSVVLLGELVEHSMERCFLLVSSRNIREGHRSHYLWGKQ